MAWRWLSKAWSTSIRTWSAATTFCVARGVRLGPIGAAQSLARIELLEDAIELLLTDEETKVGFLARASHVACLYRAILPDRLPPTWRQVARCSATGAASTSRSALSV